MSSRKYAFPVAVHSYLTVTNHITERERFLSGNVSNPDFIYRLNLAKSLIDERLAQASDDTGIVARLALIKASIGLRDNSSTLAEFRQANERAYGTLNGNYVHSLLSHYANRVTDTTQHHWAYIEEKLGIKILAAKQLLGPDFDTFNLYHSYFNTYITLDPTITDVRSGLDYLLAATELDEKGWRIRLLPGHDHAKTHHHNRTISLGQAYSPRSQSAALRIAIHEVLGHALRGPQPSLAEAEGIAVLLEQLCGLSFKFRRSYRYLAIGLGWGTIGVPMTFREVFEILWRLMLIGGKTDENRAKRDAYDECSRAFRGGRPDIAGAVLLKDKIYFEANIRAWQALTESKVGYNEFKAIIEGGKKLLDEK